MDAVKFASALLGLGGLFHAANRELNGERAHVSVRVDAQFQRGSFEVTIELSQSLLEAAKQSLLHHHEVVASAKDLLELILGGGGVFGLIKLLRGGSPKKAAVVELDSGGLSVRAGDGTTLNIRREALQLYESPAVRDDVAKVVDPLLHQDADAFEVGSPEGESVQTVTREQAVWFEPPEEMLRPVELPVTEPKTEESVVRVRKPWLTKHGRHKWTLQDGRGDFNAFIEDHEFLAKVDEGLIRIGSRDAFRVRLRLEPGDEQTTPVVYIVEKVLEYMPAPQQYRMLAEPEE